MLTEVKTDRMHYFEDELGKMQGEFKEWHRSGRLKTKCIYKGNRCHGELMAWDVYGSISCHGFAYNGEMITPAVRALVKNMLKITDEERLLIKLKWGIECLPK